MRGCRARLSTRPAAASQEILKKHSKETEAGCQLPAHAVLRSPSAVAPTSADQPFSEVLGVCRMGERHGLKYDLQRNARLVIVDLLYRHSRIGHGTALRKARRQHHVADPPGFVGA